jgi:hypothetical protein
MANELNIQLDPFSDSGLTLIAKSFKPDGTPLFLSVVMTEVGSRAYYTASLSLAFVPDGAYLISFETATDFYGQGVLYIKDGDELDLSDVETETLADARQAILVSEHNDTQADIAALNDFNPATDTVANVTLVATTTTNTDMRGTDSANTIAPDNAGITQIQTDISNLNDISPAQVNTEVDTALSDYDAPTKAELDAAEASIIVAIPSVGGIANGVWDEPYNQHTTAGTFGKLMDILRKANRAIEGEVTGTPTKTSFTTDITGYVSGAFDHELVVFVSGVLDGEARPILEYSATNGTFTFEEEWTQAPSSSDEFVILPYHVHPISEIQTGLAKTTELNATEAAILAAISSLNDLDQQEVAQAVWDYLQSATTVSVSMKEAVQKILVNANLIPATV